MKIENAGAVGADMHIYSNDSNIGNAGLDIKGVTDKELSRNLRYLRKRFEEAEKKKRKLEKKLLTATPYKKDILEAEIKRSRNNY